MKRLTEYMIPETGFSVVSEEKYKRILMEEKPSVEKVYNRLKKIEDILGDEYDLDRLRELDQADREGRVVVLPAPLGSQVWQFKYPTRIDENGEEWTICSIKKATVEPAPFGLTLSMVNQIGKIYWLSKKDAMAALRREQDG